MITTKNLSKRYGEILAVDDLTFSVAPGEVLGFLGANGAGKSTTMRMIAGFITPTTGQVTVCGHDIERSPVAAKSCMGYLPTCAACGVSNAANAVASSWNAWGWRR